jgi:hypothetical protein
MLHSNRSGSPRTVEVGTEEGNENSSSNVCSELCTTNRILRIRKGPDCVLYVEVRTSFSTSSPRSYEPEAYMSVEYRAHLGDAAPSKNTYKMDPPVTPPMPEHVLGEEILTKHKEAIC